MLIRAMAGALVLAVLGAVSIASANEVPAADATTAAIPAPAQAAQAPAAAKPASNEERMVCKAERTIGSNRVQRVCRSVAQIEREREAARSQMGKAQVCSTCGGE